MLTPYIPQLMVTIGIALLVVEVVVLGFSTFVLFFLGLSLVITGVMTGLGVIPSTWAAILLSNAVVSLVLAVLLWKPLLKMQGRVDNTRAKTDFDGHRFFVTSAVDRKGQTTYDYSGITWQLKSDEPILVGSEVEVVKAEVGVLWVVAV